MNQQGNRLGKRIKDLLRERGMTQAELARLVGTKQQTISYIVAEATPAQSSRYTHKIAEVLGVNPNWLQSGEGDRHTAIVPISVHGQQIRVHQVPVLTYDSVSIFLAGREIDPKGMLMTDRADGDRTFALEIEGDSMAPVFKAGDRVVINTTVRPEPGDYVAAQADGIVLFRRYRARHPGFELVPENEDWEVVSSQDGVDILGVMVEHRKYRNR